MKALDCSANNGDLTPSKMAGWDLIILDTTSPAWCSRNFGIARGAGRAVGFYISDRDGRAMTWGEGIDTISQITMNPLLHPIAIDTFEFLTRFEHMTASLAADSVQATINQAHADGFKAGAYGADQNAWPWYDARGVTAVADWSWVASPYAPKRPTDLHQYGGKISQGDFNDSHLTLDAFLVKTTGPYGHDQGGDDDMTPVQASQLSTVYDWITRGKAEGLAPGDVAGNEAFVYGYRLGFDGRDLPPRMASNTDAQLGREAGMKAAGH